MTLKFFAFVTTGHIRLVNGEKILASSKVNFMNLAPYVFDVDLVAKADMSYLPPLSRKKNSTQNYRFKKMTLVTFCNLLFEVFLSITL